MLEMSVPKFFRLNRAISVSAVPVAPSIDIWRSCRFLGAMLRAFGTLPGGLGRFIPCRLGANHCRLRSIGWERCGHGLTSRPLEATSSGFLDDLLSLCGYPSGSGQSLVDGSLRIRYCSAYFSRKKPTGGLPHFGGVAALVSVVGVHPPVVGLWGSGDVSGLGISDNGGRKKIRLTKKTNVRKRFGVDLWGSQFPNVGRLTLS